MLVLHHAPQENQDESEEADDLDREAGEQEIVGCLCRNRRLLAPGLLRLGDTGESSASNLDDGGDDVGGAVRRMIREVRTIRWASSRSQPERARLWSRERSYITHMKTQTKILALKPRIRRETSFGSRCRASRREM